MADEVRTEQNDYSGKYLTFRLMDETYGIHVSAILQIIAIPQITPIPKTPAFVKGVINLRGKIIPVVDLRLRFVLEHTEYDERTSIIIIRTSAGEGEIFIGIIVDTVLEVLDIVSEQIEEKPSFGVKLDTDFILGMAKVKKTVVTLLDIENVLTREELVKLTEV
ncbi:MAG: chemotaxis protein CheW [Candidatus Cloacimonetes bacterium]|nr:chemotaxis protein CheW [Candidatus Cloacimonadota bacterium]